MSSLLSTEVSDLNKGFVPERFLNDILDAFDKTNFSLHILSPVQEYVPSLAGEVIGIYFGHDQLYTLRVSVSIELLHLDCLFTLSY